MCNFSTCCFNNRLDGHKLLDLLRGKRLVFVGDSLNRNMWESLICILKNSVKDKKNVYEANGRVHFRGEASYSFVFKVSIDIGLLCVFYSSVIDLFVITLLLMIMVWHQWFCRIITSLWSFLCRRS